jgi:hypothetical protein
LGQCKKLQHQKLLRLLGASAVMRSMMSIIITEESARTTTDSIFPLRKQATLISFLWFLFLPWSVLTIGKWNNLCTDWIGYQ